MGNYDPSKHFGFNLIPPKSEQEIEILEERDNSVVYGFLLIFFAVFLYFILSLIQLVAIDTRLDHNKSILVKREATINSYNNTVAEHGELFLKAKTLSLILKRDIRTKEFLNLSQQIVSSINGTEILDYTREDDEKFTITVLMSNFANTTDLINNSKDYSQALNFRIENINRVGEEDQVKVVVSFSLENT
jgi:hypothetical protein